MEDSPFSERSVIFQQFFTIVHVARK